MSNLNNEVFLTKQGLEELKKEYRELTQKKRPEILEKIQSARSLGDLSENAAYHQARREQSFIDGRILELEELLQNAKIVINQGNGIVQLGSKVKVKLDSDEQELILVSEVEADIANGKISHKSPIGQALLGKKQGDVVEVEAPVGKIRYTILNVA
ncbi:MAG: transcription elongation factor GreA [Candidatus Cloacimonetes bacterium]|nr:transcription elongation factor GreA [Candidatus Cloacimonadota bacterium]